jgi:flagellar capping protein FliD
LVTRITGLSSGMDIDGLVSKLMQAEQIPLDNLKKQKTKNEWLQDAYRAINTSIYPVRDQAKTLQYNYNWPTVTRDANGNVDQSVVDAIYNKISGLISAYNDTTVALKTKIDETPDRNYQPLTSDEKKAMSDDDVANWEKKAQTGLLSRDSLVTKAYNDLRSDVTKPIEGLEGATFSSLADIGITTGPYDKTNTSTAGKLYVDSDKLKAAIAQDPEAVIKMFTQHGTGDGRGIAQRIYEDMGNAMTQISNKAGSANGSYTTTATILGKQDADLDVKIAEMVEKINKKEDYYYSIFSTMEQAIANGNAQMSWLSSQFG